MEQAVAGYDITTIASVSSINTQKQKGLVFPRTHLLLYEEDHKFSLISPNNQYEENYLLGGEKYVTKGKNTMHLRVGR